MPQKEIVLTVKLPLNSWQCLVAMSAQDVREPENFILWLVIREAQRRGLLADEPALTPSTPAPAPH